MALGALVKKIFDTNNTNAAAVVQASFINALEQKDTAERQDAQRLVDWYNRDRTAIIDHLKEQAKESFDSTDDWQWPIVNGVPRTISRRSTAYKSPPSRTYRLGDKELDDDDEVVKAVNEMYAGIDINRKLRSLDRWSTLLNTCHVEVVHRKKVIDWDIRLRPSVTVVQDPEDFLEFIKFAYQWKPVNPDTLQPVDGWIYWTDEEHVFVGKGGYWAGMSNEAGTNPYKDADGEPVIPIVTVRKLEDIDDYWGRFGADLVDATQTMNVQLGNLWETMTHQTHGQPLFINIDLEDGSKPLIGSKHPFVVKKVMKDEVEPNIKFPKPDPDFAEVRDVLDWFLKLNAGAYGLPPSAWSMDEQRLSGFAKFMDNIELMESREEEIENWQRVEQDLLTKSAIVWNTLKLGTPVPIELEVELEFPEVKIPETPTEKITRWTLAIKAGAASLVDYFVEEKGMDEEKALERAQAVAEQNKELGAAATPEAPLPGAPAITRGRPEEEGEE
jgi:hypothetical protein